MSLFRRATTLLAIIAGILHVSQATSVRMLRTSGTSLKSSTAAGTCKEWCGGSFEKKGSKVVCAWAACAGCQPCAPESVPEPKPISDPVPVVAPTKECKGWCDGSFKKKDSKEVCAWAPCAGCQPCVSGSVPEPKPIPDTVPVVEPTKKCAGWCGNSFKVQEKKPGSNKEKANEVVCKWETCAGCERCQPEPISNPVKNSEKCQDVPGWKNKLGKTCNDYLTNNWCANGAAVPGNEWALGPKWNMPENNCCVCGLTPPPKPANAEEKVILDNADGCNNHPCQNHGSCLKRPDGMPVCVCVGGFTGEFCEIPPSPGELEVRDPTSDEAKRVLGTVLESLNEKRSKNEMGPVSLKAIVSYTTQVVSGTLHTFCIESQNDGFIQMTWDDFAFGPGPHLASVMPLHKIFKWVGGKTTEMVCTAMPTEYDGGLSAAGVSPGALAELQARRTLEKMKLKHKQHTAQSLIEAKTETYPLPLNWDARVDHTRSDKCSALISEPADQGTCGSCYAFAALQTASIRACMAGHDISKKGFSVQDVLNCGSQWEGDMQNNVPPHSKGRKMANNCAGWLSLNVFEFATKYGLVDSACQDYAHAGDPLTHFDADAGAQECLLTNKGNVPANPEVEVSVGITEEYSDVLNSILPTIKNKAIKSFTMEQNIAMANMDLRDFDLEYSRFLGSVTEFYLALRIPEEMKAVKRASLGRKIAPGETVSVDNMAFCGKPGSVKKWMGNVHAEPKVEPHCVARLQETYLEADKFSVHCKTDPQHKTYLSGPKGETLGGLDNSICECTAEQRVYQKKWKPYPLSINLAPTLSQLGNEARGECHRDRNSGEFDFEAEHK